jgi:hypothetical protein
MQAEAALEELAAEFQDYNEGGGGDVNGNLESGESILDVVRRASLRCWPRHPA